MCDFFSVTSDGKGNILYFDNEIRKKILAKELDYEADSHTSINHYYGFKGVDEDSRNKYEFNPFTGKFIIDRINSLDDSKEVEKKVRALDFSTIVPELIIKPIVHPFRIKANDVTDNDICNLRKWGSVWSSAGASVRDSVRSSVESSVESLVWSLVGVSVRGSICSSVWSLDGTLDKDSVWSLFRDSLWSSVVSLDWSSVWSLFGSSVSAYISSFYKLEKWKYIEHVPFVNPYQCLIDLWERGFVPSFDGKTWRLHSGEKAQAVYSEDIAA